MANAFPTSLNSYTPGANSATLSSAGHAAEHNALEAKIGVDSSAVTTSIDYLLKNTSSSDPGHKHTSASISGQTFPASGILVGTTDSQTLSSKTLTKPIVNGSVPAISTYSPGGGGTATLDLSNANIHFITMPAGNITIALSNVTVNQVFIIRILQDSGGSRTVTWFTTLKWAGGSAPTLTTTASKADTFGFICTSSGNYDGYVIGQNI